MKTADLSIILPAYMEAVRIERTLQDLAAFLVTRDYGNVEVIVVTAESQDQTLSLAQAQAGLFENFTVINPGVKRGKGRDVRAGILAATGRYRVFMDADLATPLHHLDEVWDLANHGVKVGIGVRRLKSIHTEPIRRFVSTVGNVLAQVVLLPGITDTQCGFKFFEAGAAEAIFSRMTILGWGFDLEILAIARKLGYAIKTIAVPDWHDPKSSDEGFVGDSAAGAALKVFKDLFTIRYNITLGRYKSPTFNRSNP